MLPVDGAEFLLLPTFRCKRLYQRHAGDMLLYKCIQACYGIPDLDEGPVNAFLEKISSQDQEWKGARQTKVSVASTRNI